jgi:3-isopropylmalate dehydrogenase
MKRIVLLPGDGIGPQVIGEAKACLKLLSARLELGLIFEEHPIGGAAIEDCGEPLPAATLEACRCADAILLGAVGGPRWDDCEKRPEAALLDLRQALGLFANLRPAKPTRGLEHLSPLRRHVTSGADILIVRELTGGIYFGKKSSKPDRASDLCAYSREEIERVAHVAFRAASRRRGKVASIDKANVLATSKLWRCAVEDVAAAYPAVRLEHMLIDAAAMAVITNPRRFDVILTENMFGDILSDELAVISGSIGLLPSASIGSRGPALFEPIHGSAPDLAKDAANPIGAILSAAMLLDIGLGLSNAAGLLRGAIENILQSGPLTADLGGSATRSRMAGAIRAELDRRLGAGDAHAQLMAMNRGCCA